MVSKEFTVIKEFMVQYKKSEWSSPDKVHVSRRSLYNRKRASGARNTKFVHHIGCSSKAVSGVVVRFFQVCASGSSWSFRVHSQNIEHSTIEKEQA